MKSSLQKIRNLETYLRNFFLPELECGFSYVTTQGTATTRLARLAGDQVLSARPEIQLTSPQGEGVSYLLDTVIFVLDKDLGNGKTPEGEEEQFDRLQAKALEILERIRRDATEGHCGLLSGLVLYDARILPQASVFGSWCGFSIEISFQG